MPTGHEGDLIDRIRRKSKAAASVALGIGDDAAVVQAGADGSQLLVTTDVLMEGVHFDLSAATPEQVGRKSLAVNLSDIAAMAGRPTAAFIGLVLPRSHGAAFGDGLMHGAFTLAAEFDVAIAGGDTNIWDGPAVISVTLLGKPGGKGPVTRRGARVGDWLMVTGALGGSLCGRHLSFTPRVREALALNAHFDIHAMIDLSDGLASDLQHIADESNVGAVVDSVAIPIHADVDPSLRAVERLKLALSDGEDFELLFAVDPAAGRQILDRPPFEAAITKIGEVGSERGCRLRTGSDTLIDLEPTGWQHRFDAGNPQG